MELEGEVFFGTGREIFEQIKERRNPLEKTIKDLEVLFNAGDF